MDSVIIIPTHNPGRELVSYVEELISACVPHVIVVNDGSDAEYSQIFEELSMLPGVTLLVQAENDRESAMALAVDYYESHLLPLGVTGVRTVIFENEEQAERVLIAAEENSTFTKTAENSNIVKRMIDRILLAIRPVRIASS